MESSYYTINACNRCRKRKARCDTRIPSCRPCQISGSACEYTEARSKDVFPRSFIVDLEERLAHLEDKVRRCRLETNARNIGNQQDVDAPSQHRDPQHAVPGLRNMPGLPSPGDDIPYPRHSHEHLTSSVLETSSFDGRGAQASLARATDQQPKWQATLPSRQVAMNLIEVFFSQYQVQFPILVEPEFRSTVEHHYRSPGVQGKELEPSTAFMLNMVFAIALIFASEESHQALEMSKAFAASAMSKLPDVLSRKETRTLQCLLLLLFYSALDSSSTPAWFISGICMRLCIDLGFGSEANLQMSGPGDEDDGALARRLFWISYTFDQTLSVLLGRPFTFEDPSIDVNLPSTVSRYLRDRQFLHWIQLQRLQTSIVRRLQSESLNQHEAAELITWKQDMAKALDRWNDAARNLTDLDGHGKDWWCYWYFNTLVILHRPPLSKTQLQGSDLRPCFTATRRLIELAFIRTSRTLADLTWIDLHYQMMSGITLLFVVRKNAAVRRMASTDWISFRSSVCQWKVILERLAHRWESIGSVVDALLKLADTTVDLVDKDINSSARVQYDSEAARRERRRSVVKQLHWRIQTPPAHIMYGLSAQTDIEPPAPHTEQNMQRSTAGLTQQPSGEGSQTIYPAMSQSWVSDGQYADPALESEYATLGMDIDVDLSPRLPEDFWPSIGLPPESGVPSDDLAFWAQFSNPMMGTADAALPFVGGTVQQTDALLADSILNFRGDFIEQESQDFML